MTYNLDAHHPCALQAAIVHILDICHCPLLIYPDSLGVQASSRALLETNPNVYATTTERSMLP